jgi:polyphosphate:AMP phosphotransferase
MFEIAEVGRTVSRKDFKKAAPLVRQELLELQQRLLKEKGFRTILVFAGVDGAGKSDSVALLNQWMDARWLSTCAYDEPTNSEKDRPEFWRYWRDLPPRGRIGMFLSAWYSQPVLDRVYGAIDDSAFLKHLERILAFETALAEEGALIVKFWMHLSHEEQEKRLKSLEDDPLALARVSEKDWAHWRIYDRFIEAAEQVVARTNIGKASWTIVEGADPNYRSLKVTSTLLDALHRKFDASPVSNTDVEAAVEKSTKMKKESKKNVSNADVEIAGGLPSSDLTILNKLDMKKSVEKSAYETELKELQSRLYNLHLLARDRGISSILLFEGPDAAGKGGAIRRVTAALQPRNYQVHGIAAPTEDELAQHYLWRFWRNLSRAGRITVFDRSWYGRVLVERVEGFASDGAWRRAYAEINDFESQLCEHGIVLLKYWIHITKDEQLKRFKQREKTAYKSWKLTDEDWRNRERWHDYELAVHDMVQYTSTGQAPWILIEGNDKRYARLKVLRSFCERLAASLDESGREGLENAAQ